MKILNKDIDGFWIFIISLFCIWVSSFFIEYMFWTIQFPYFVLLLVSFFLSSEQLYVQKAKNDTGKIVGDNNIRHSVLSNYYLEIGPYRFYGLGGFVHPFYASLVKSSEGVVVGSPHLFRESQENVHILGTTRKIHRNDLPLEYYYAVKEYFNFDFEYLYQVIPFPHHLQHKFFLDDKQLSAVYTDILSELDLITKTSNFRKNLIDEIGTDVGDYIDSTSARISSSLKPFKKKHIKQLTEEK